MYACEYVCARVCFGGRLSSKAAYVSSIQKTTYVHTQVGQFLEEAGKTLGAPVAISGFLRLKCGEGE